MPIHLTRGSFFLDVRQLAARGEFAIPADDAPASQCAETEESHQTHDSNLRCVRAASSMPVELVVCAGCSTGRQSYGTLGKWLDRLRTPPAVSGQSMFHRETWRVASWRRPKSHMVDPNESSRPKPSTPCSQKLFFFGGADLSVVRQKSRSLGTWNGRLRVRSLRTDRSERLKFDRALARRRAPRANNSDDQQKM